MRSTPCTEPDMAVVGRPALRAAADSGQWRRERIHPGRLGGRAAEADQASGCALNARTASRSSSAHIVIARNPRCLRLALLRKPRGLSTKLDIVSVEVIACAKFSGRVVDRTDSLLFLWNFSWWATSG